jgi:adenylate cyclase
LDLAAAVDDHPVGIAANAGVAFVGNVGSGTVMDFTALGDAVNIGARMQGHARPGQVVLAAALYDLVADRYPDAHAERVTVRGREEPIEVHVLGRGA